MKETAVELEINYHKNQAKIFFESDKRYKVIAKGRRFGLTRGFANYVIERMSEGVTPVLWIDTIYGNIERYVERYFMPVLKAYPSTYYKYRSNRNDLKIGKAVCDFRSADKPENIEGFGYALIIINEAGIVLKNRKLWDESIRPMILDYKAEVLIGGTPKGKVVKKRNEVHLFYELFLRGEKSKVKPSTAGKSEKGNPPLNPSQEGNFEDWQAFNFSTYDNPYLDKAEIDELVKEISPALRDQEVFGLFVDTDKTGIIKSEWWNYYEGDEYRYKRIYKIMQSWDTAFKKNEENDFSVCTTWAVTDNGYYLIDMWRDRAEFPELKRNFIKQYESWKPHQVLIEDKASGQSLIQEIQSNTRIPIKAIKTDKDKVTRVHSITPIIEAGKVYLPKDKKWTEIFTKECEDFPNGQFDDIVDTVSQLLNEEREIKNPEAKNIIHLPRNIFRFNKYKTYRK